MWNLVHTILETDSLAVGSTGLVVLMRAIHMCVIDKLMFVQVSELDRVLKLHKVMLMDPWLRFFSNVLGWVRRAHAHGCFVVFKHVRVG